MTEKRDEIKSEACRKEVFYFEKMEVSNFHNDVILAAQCRADVDKFCKDVPPGESTPHAAAPCRLIPASKVQSAWHCPVTPPWLPAR